MTDRKKVIDGLRHCTAWAGLHECQPKIGPDCPYEDEADCKLALMRDALTLLKEQEPVKPKTDDAWPSRIKVCGACGTCLFAVGDYKPKYCSECGRMVDWE